MLHVCILSKLQWNHFSLPDELLPAEEPGADVVVGGGADEGGGGGGDVLHPFPLPVVHGMVPAVPVLNPPSSFFVLLVLYFLHSSTYTISY